MASASPPELRPSWLAWPEVQALLAAFPHDDLRFVGGCVRDAWLGLDAKDWDAATRLKPHEVIDKIKALGWNAYPTGLSHGTVLAVAPGARFKVEITTLREDLETDGRHAKVGFTDSYAADAARRDLTFNALYLDAEGRLHDYFGGLEDLVAGRVRFIGKATQRLAEDHLRALRYLRFYARFGHVSPEASTLSAIRKNNPKLVYLSVERVANEMQALLLGPNPIQGLRLAEEMDLLAHLAPGRWDLDALASLIEGLGGKTNQAHKETFIGQKEIFVLYLYILRGGRAKDAEGRATQSLLRHWKRPKIEFQFLKQILAAQSVSLNEALYRHGPKVARAVLALGPDWGEEAAKRIREWQGMRFPIGGTDLQAFGLEGPELGHELKRLEQAWVDSGFTLNRQKLLAEVAKTKA